MLVPVILSGGAGTRLWPVSREGHPKPFMRLADGQSLLQKTFLRGARQEGAGEVLTITNRDYYFRSKDEYAALRQREPRQSFLLEPFGRNTAAAITRATKDKTRNFCPMGRWWIQRNMNNSRRARRNAPWTGPACAQGGIRDRSPLNGPQGGFGGWESALRVLLRICSTG